MNAHKISSQILPSTTPISKWKTNLIGILSSMDSNFPVTLWDRLILHATFIIILLRSLHIPLVLLAYSLLYGNFDYNRVRIAPAGTKVVAYTAADKQTSFAPYGRVGRYLRPSPEGMYASERQPSLPMRRNNWPNMAMLHSNIPQAGGDKLVGQSYFLLLWMIMNQIFLQRRLQPSFLHDK